LLLTALNKIEQLDDPIDKDALYKDLMLVCTKNNFCDLAESIINKIWDKQVKVESIKSIFDECKSNDDVFIERLLKLSFEITQNILNEQIKKQAYDLTIALCFLYKKFDLAHTFIQKITNNKEKIKNLLSLSIEYQKNAQAVESKNILDEAVSETALLYKQEEREELQSLIEKTKQFVISEIFTVSDEEKKRLQAKEFLDEAKGIAKTIKVDSTYDNSCNHKAHFYIELSKLYRQINLLAVADELISRFDIFFCRRSTRNNEYPRCELIDSVAFLYLESNKLDDIKNIYSKSSCRIPLEIKLELNLKVDDYYEISDYFTNHNYVENFRFLKEKCDVENMYRDNYINLLKEIVYGYKKDIESDMPLKYSEIDSFDILDILNTIALLTPKENLASVASLYLDLNYDKKAREVLNRAIQYKNEYNLSEIAKVYLKIGNFSKVIQLAESEKEEEINLTIAKYYLDNKMYDKAYTVSNYNSSPDGELLWRIAKEYIQNNNIEMGLKIYTNFPQPKSRYETSYSVNIFEDILKYYLKNNQDDMFEKLIFKKICEERWGNIGNVVDLIKQHKNHKYIFEKLITEIKNNETCQTSVKDDFFYQLINYFIDYDDIDGAKKVLSYIGVNGNYVSYAKEEIALYYLKNRDIDKAFDLFDTSEDGKPIYIKAYIRFLIELGIQYVETKNYEKAYEIHSKIIDLDNFTALLDSVRLRDSIILGYIDDGNDVKAELELQKFSEKYYNAPPRNAAEALVYYYLKHNMIINALNILEKYLYENRDILAELTRQIIGANKEEKINDIVKKLKSDFSKIYILITAVKILLKNQD